MRKLIQGGTIVNEGRSFIGSLIIENDCIIEIIENNETPRGEFDEIVNATGCFVLPGVIDDHVHFREPGLTEKADIESESRAAAYGGVTSYFWDAKHEPTNATLEALQDKWERAKQQVMLTIASSLVQQMLIISYSLNSTSTLFLE